MVFRPDVREAVVMSGFGRGADWLRNIEANDEARVTIGTRSFAAAHRILNADEAVAVITDYEWRSRFAAPIVRAVLSRLLGWRYHGTQADKRRLAAQLPLVAFRPRS